MKEHRFERQVRMLVEKVRHDSEVIAESFKEGDRTAFTVPSSQFGKVPALRVELNELEQWERWQDPYARLQVMEGILAEQGPEGLQKYREKMAQLSVKAMEAENG